MIDDGAMVQIVAAAGRAVGFSEMVEGGVKVELPELEIGKLNRLDDESPGGYFGGFVEIIWRRVAVVGGVVMMASALVEEAYDDVLSASTAYR